MILATEIVLLVLGALAVTGTCLGLASGDYSPKEATIVTVLALACLAALVGLEVCK